jgi:hypothetical protein
METSRHDQDTEGKSFAPLPQAQAYEQEDCGEGRGKKPGKTASQALVATRHATE